MWGAKDAQLQYNFNSANFNNALEKARQETMLFAASVLHKNAEVHLTERQTDAINKTIAQGWQRLYLEAQQIAVQRTAVKNQKKQWEKENKLFKDKLEQDLNIFTSTNKREWTNVVSKTISNIVGGAAGAVILKGAVGKFMPGIGIPVGNTHLLKQMSMPYGAGGGYYGGFQ